MSANAQVGKVNTPDPTPDPVTPEPKDPVVEPPVTQPPIADNDGSIKYKLPFNENGQNFYLPVDNSMGEWRANEELGFLYEDFNEGRLSKDWISVAGKWSQENRLLHQSETGESNCNLYIPLRQDGRKAYLYQFKARFLTEGNNKRFGLHFMASDGKLSNRGDSYLLWFRHHKSQGDKVEVYRSEGNKMPGPKKSMFLPSQFQPLEWYDIKILYDPARRSIMAYLENQEVLSWNIEETPFSAGAAISLRIGNSQVQFDNIRVYQLAADPLLSLSVGRDGMIRSDSRGKEEARVLSIQKRSQNRNLWSAMKEEDLKLK